MIEPYNGPCGLPFAQKMAILNFVLECKLYQLTTGVEFDGEFNGGSFESNKPFLNHVMVQCIWTPILPKSWNSMVMNGCFEANKFILNS